MSYSIFCLEYNWLTPHLKQQKPNQTCTFLMPNCCCARCFQVVCHVAGLTWGDVTMCGWGTDVWSSGDDRDSWRSGSEGREGQHRGYRSLWLHKHTDTQPRTHQHCNMMLYHLRLMINTLLTGGLGRFFLLVVDLEPEKRLFRAASAALALATFLLGPVPRKTCLSTSTCYNTQRWVCLLIRFTTNVPLMFITRLKLFRIKAKTNNLLILSYLSCLPI